MSHEVLVNYLREQWIKLSGKYSRDDDLIHRLFLEIQTAYSSPDRNYHNLHHIDNMIKLSNQYQNHFHEKDTLDFSIFYHDIIYEVEKSDNEERSGRIAQRNLEILKVPQRRITATVQYIDASKMHTLEEGENESDLAWFLDFDMSILGSDWQSYLEYARQVRKEFGNFPDIVYNQGRKLFLQQSLNMPYIYHTSRFRSEYEPQARKNIQKELLQL